MLSVKKLSKQFGDFTAVENVSFDIEKGTIVGLLGHNGAGKTTVMKMISGYLEPTTGDISLNQDNLLEDPKKMHQVLGYLPENSPLYPDMKVFEYLDFIASTRNIPVTVRPEKIKNALLTTDLMNRAFSPIQSLSRGLKQRVGVAQAILGNPDVVILDEPTNGLDPDQTQHMRNLIKQLGKQATVILSTHIMQEVEAVCDQVLILRNGQLVVNDELKTLQNSQHILLSTNANLDQLIFTTRQLQIIQSIDLLKNQGGKSEYRIHLSSSNEKGSEEMDHTVHQLAHRLIADDYKLYQITHEKRDLETLFREVSEGKTISNSDHPEVSNAA